MIEVKVGNRKPNKLQQEFHEAWNGRRIEIARSLDDVPRILGLEPRKETA